jgi:hypothetical protein
MRANRLIIRLLVALSLLQTLVALSVAAGVSRPVAAWGLPPTPGPLPTIEWRAPSPKALLIFTHIQRQVGQGGRSAKLGRCRAGAAVLAR